MNNLLKTIVIIIVISNLFDFENCCAQQSEPGNFTSESIENILDNYYNSILGAGEGVNIFATSEWYTDRPGKAEYLLFLQLDAKANVEKLIFTPRKFKFFEYSDSASIYLYKGDSIYSINYLDKVIFDKEKRKELKYYTGYGMLNSSPIVNNRLIKDLYSSLDDFRVIDNHTIEILMDGGNICYINVDKGVIERFVKNSGSYKIVYKYSYKTTERWDSIVVDILSNGMNYNEELRVINYNKLVDSVNYLVQMDLVGLDGRVQSISSMEEKPKLLYFWHKSCYPCLKFMKDLQKKDDILKNYNVLLIGINPIDELDNNRLLELVERAGDTYSHYTITNEVYAPISFGVYPQFILLDGQNNFLYHSLGYPGKSLFKDVRKKIKTLSQ